MTAGSRRKGVGRVWVPLVVAVAVLLGGVAVTQLRGLFGSEAIFSMSGRDAAPLEATHVKTVVYELTGPAATAGTAVYLDHDAAARQVHFVGLPWSTTVTTTSPAVLANLVAQGDSETLVCRIVINGAVEDQQSTTGHSAHTSCLVKAG